jgi:hypothetical protein
LCSLEIGQLAHKGGRQNYQNVSKKPARVSQPVAGFLLRFSKKSNHE